MTGPYETAAFTYLHIGWSPLPLPVRRKEPPPKDWTGHGAPMASGADVTAWLEEGKGADNIAVRVPDCVIGIDVDGYGDKRGVTTMRQALDKLGPLPPAPRSTSRGAEDRSGIRFYRVPAGRSWPGALGRGVEIISHDYRYAVVAPSIHPEGRPYQWLDPDGRPLARPPDVDQLPDLPEPWVKHLEQGAADEQRRTEGATDEQVQAYLAGLEDGPPCRYVQRLLDELARALESREEDRHDAQLKPVGKLLRAGGQGHVGVPTALDTMHAMWLQALARPGDAREPTPDEWERSVARAVAWQLEDPTPEEDKGCCGAEPPEPTILDEEDRPPQPRDGLEELVRRAHPQSGFTGKAGVKVLTVARHIVKELGLRYALDGHDEGRFYLYDHGVWVPEGGVVNAIVTRLLGDKHRHSNITNVRDSLRSFRPLSVIHADPVPQYLNVRNGLVDWRTGQLLEHTPQVLSTVQLPVVWDERATCPAFEEFLAEVLPEDCVKSPNGAPPFAWQLLGYLVYAGNPHHKAILLRGSGRNGKGTLLHVMERLLGASNVSGVSLLDLGDNRFAPADMLGKVANIAGDIDPQWLQATGRFKMLTGGDTIRGEHKYGNSFAFRPWCVPVFSSNDDFGSIDNSEGFFARWIVVPFPNDFTESNVDAETLRARLTTASELAGILRHAAEALPHVLDHGFSAVGSVTEARRRFIERGDRVRAWITEECELDTEAWTARTELHRVFTQWAAREGGKLMSAREFYARLEGLPRLRPATRMGTRGFAGIGIR